MSINVKIPFKFKITIPLLLIIAIIDAFSLLIFARVDLIVHKDLYNYGLQFSHEWAYGYWTWSLWLLNSLTIAIMFVGISIASLSLYARAKNNILRLAHHVSLTVAILLTIFSAFALINIDNIVNSDLYRYGLQFSYEWATNYWVSVRLMLGLIGLSIAISLFSFTLVSLSTRKQVIINLTKLTYFTLITIGAISLVLSTIYVSSILAFIGLGLTFWGIILVYIRTDEYIKGELLNATTLSLLETLNQLLKELDYKGEATYLPPKYLIDPEASKVYIPKQEEGKLPTPEQTYKQGNKLFLDNPEGILLNPPGAELSKLFEKTIQTSFTRIDIQYLQQKMPKLFIEDLEIAQNFDIQIEENKIHVKIENSVYKDLTKKAVELKKVFSLLGCPLSSAIACALAKASGKPISIENQQISENGKNIEVRYRIKGEEQKAQ